MDDETLSISPEEIQRLSPADQRDLQNFVQAKNQEAQVQRSMYLLFSSHPFFCARHGAFRIDLFPYIMHRRLLTFPSHPYFNEVAGKMPC